MLFHARARKEAEGPLGLAFRVGEETFGHVRKELKELKGALTDMRAQPD
jgi:hypothetical protein